MPPKKTTGRVRKDGAAAKQSKLSRQHKPAHMSLEEWQIELRRQFGRDQPFQLANLGEHPVFSEFNCTNPQSGNTYKVRIRGRGVGDNTCTCPDFATNTLGTCKHIEFTLSRLERKRSTRALLRAGFQPPASEVYLQYGARREVRFRPGAESPVEVARLAAKYFDAEGALKPRAVATFGTFLSEAAEHEPDLACGDDVLAYLAELRDAERREKLVNEAFPQGPRSPAFEDLLKVPLYDYQCQGALFAARAGRCLIGDEMGLGKTIQALAAAEIMARLFGVERVLIVCPTSLKFQWQREIERFTTRTAGVISGMRPARRLAFQESGHFFKITNYDTVHTDLDAIQEWSPDLVILDEAQRIKNWATRVARSVKKISSPHAIVLTGTPLENRLEELVSIVQFVDLFRLGPTFRLLHEHQLRDEVGKVIGYRDLDRLGQTLAPILLRRQKEQVLDQLPGRIDSNVFVPLTQYQRDLHTENQEVVARIVYKWRKYKFLSEADQRRLMIALQRMRMVCDSSYLLDTASDQGNKTGEVMTLLGEILERPESKVVVFSQWLKMHDLLVKRLQHHKVEHVLFHGGVPSVKRKNLVDRFREDPDCRVFLATDAGGVGLNLQFANVVLNIDLPWNPAVLEQRIGRVHRLGQSQPVRVVNFVARGAIEEGMLEVLRFKKSLFAGVLDGGEKEVFLGGTRLTKFMETVEAATAAIPASVQEEEPEPETPAVAEETPPQPKPQPVPPPPVETVAPPAPPTVAPTVPPAAPPAPAAPAPVNPWAGLLQAGLSLLQQLATPAAATPSNGQSPAPLVQRDERTGESYVRLPVPPPQVIDQALTALQQLMQSLRQS
jgi:superfamily II DNA or RNA helicase